MKTVDITKPCVNVRDKVWMFHTYALADYLGIDKDIPIQGTVLGVETEIDPNSYVYYWVEPDGAPEEVLSDIIEGEVWLPLYRCGHAEIMNDGIFLSKEDALEWLKRQNELIEKDNKNA